MRAPFALLIAAVAPQILPAQHHHEAPAAASVLDLSQSRTASGTAWLPDDAPVPGFHRRAGRWDLMLHGHAFLQAIRVTGRRAQSQVGSANWFMGMASRVGARDAVRARLMLTLEPFLLPGAGYPQLLQVAHDYRGSPAPDRQHPHELLPEISLAYERRVAAGVALSLYGAPVGEPALGPVAYYHRPSAAYEPTAPLSHVAQDYTHESLGVVTVGVFSRRARVEASLFNGSHPDDKHANFDLQGGRLNAFAARLTIAPSRFVVASAWGGYIPAESGAHAHEAQYKLGASLLHITAGGTWSTAAIYGANVPAGSSLVLGTALLESTVVLNRRHILFGRLEYARRTAEELDLTGSVPATADIGAVSGGYAWRAPVGHAASVALGGRVTVSFVPGALEQFYGSRAPISLLAYIALGGPFASSRLAAPR